MVCGESSLFWEMLHSLAHLYSICKIVHLRNYVDKWFLHRKSRIRLLRCCVTRCQYLLCLFFRFFVLREVLHHSHLNEMNNASLSAVPWSMPTKTKIVLVFHILYQPLSSMFFAFRNYSPFIRSSMLTEFCSLVELI